MLPDKIRYFSHHLTVRIYSYMYPALFTLVVTATSDSLTM